MGPGSLLVPELRAEAAGVAGLQEAFVTHPLFLPQSTVRRPPCTWPHATSAVCCFCPVFAKMFVSAGDHVLVSVLPELS